ncbi:MAG TPA: LytTR family DNA-binding domain-containing protein, partial [Caulobacteraceae bacterium]|nr:LytTR family DNA-binding domain-containing protein [Caulobacteraceae bacterium]
HYRFSDAVRAMGARGVQVHRSWWVARSAVTGVEREGDRHVLRLTGGVRAPVSRTYGLAAREAGLIPRD